MSDFIVTFSFSFDNSVVSWRRAAARSGFYPTYVIATRVGRRLTGKSLQSTMQENKCVLCALIPYICATFTRYLGVIIIDIETIFEITFSPWLMVMVLISYFNAISLILWPKVWAHLLVKDNIIFEQSRLKV